MGYRDYAKDFQVEYVQQPGKKRPKAVRTYVGPWFRFTASPERIAWLRRFYPAGLALVAVLLIIPMCIDCAFTRTWFIQVPAAAAWIPWVLAVGSAWRLWTAGEKMDREHNSLVHDRMSGATLFLMGFCSVSAVGCVIRLTELTATAGDYAVCLCDLASAVCAMALFAKRKELTSVQISEEK